MHLLFTYKKVFCIACKMTCFHNRPKDASALLCLCVVPTSTIWDRERCICPNLAATNTERKRVQSGIVLRCSIPQPKTKHVRLWSKQRARTESTSTIRADASQSVPFQICFERSQIIVQGLSKARNTILDKPRYHRSVDGNLSTLESLWIVDTWYISFSKICIIPDTKMLHA